MAGLLAVTAGAALSGLKHYYWHPPASAGERIVDIPLKSGIAAIGGLLQKQGVVRSGSAFRFYVLITGQARLLKAGEYAFPSGEELPRVVRRLASGKVVRRTLTVPEGFTARQIADKLEAGKLSDGNAFMAEVHNPVLARELNVPSESLEGFLFPDTYEIPKGLPARQIVRRMVVRFHQKTGEALRQSAQAQGLTELQWVTLASIIEREVRVPEERAKVASVFYNRLRKRMRLESCATVLYGLRRAGGPLSLDDLNDRSPYNTYRHAGLPPGPISNPGLSSLEAAAHPAQTDYLFFVVRPDGQHVFSCDFESHKRAKWKQKRARKSEEVGSKPIGRP